jgi:hypothetical protein
MVMLPQVSWLFFKAVRAGLAVTTSFPHHFRAPNDLDLSRGRKNGAGGALLVPCRRPILNATTSPFRAGWFRAQTQGAAPLYPGLNFSYAFGV